MLEGGDVFAEDVEFEVDVGAEGDAAEVGVLHGIGDDGYAEGAGGGVAHGEADAVDCDGAFFDGEVSAAAHFGGDVVGEAEVAGAVDVFDLVADGGAVHVALDDVAVQAAVHYH